MKLKIDWEEVLTSLPPYINTHPKDLIKAMQEYHHQLEKALEKVIEDCLDIQESNMAMEEHQATETCTCEERKVLVRYGYLWYRGGVWCRIPAVYDAMKDPLPIINCPCCGKPLPMEAKP